MTTDQFQTFFLAILAILTEFSNYVPLEDYLRLFKYLQVLFSDEAESKIRSVAADQRCLFRFYILPLFNINMS